MVGRMIGYVFITIWAFCGGEFGPHRRHFSLVAACCCCGKTTTTTFLERRRLDQDKEHQDQDQDQEEGKIWNHI